MRISKKRIKKTKELLASLQQEGEGEGEEEERTK
jgi:hypothetical protein